MSGVDGVGPSFGRLWPWTETGHPAIVLVVLSLHPLPRHSLPHHAMPSPQRCQTMSRHGRPMAKLWRSARRPRSGLSSWGPCSISLLAQAHSHTHAWMPVSCTRLPRNQEHRQWRDTLLDRHALKSPGALGSAIYLEELALQIAEHFGDIVDFLNRQEFVPGDEQSEDYMED